MFKNKKILITQNSLRQFAGSEIVVLELAHWLQQKGAKVIVFTWIYDGQIVEEFQNRKIHVTTDENDDAFNADFDYIWVHHQVLPEKLIRRLSNLHAKFIFNHMSFLPELYIEQPYIYGLEKNISSMNLFVSPEVEDFIRGTCLDLGSSAMSCLFQNPAPTAFTKMNYKQKEKAKNILVISNHIPDEVRDALKLLELSGVKTSLIGQSSQNSSLIDAKTISKYDIVISIGKTVQYCLVSGVPVYVYDKYGGCGFLNGDNLKIAEYHNFSGRGFQTKSAETIANEIINNYKTAIEYQRSQKINFRKKYALDIVLPAIFKKIDKCKLRKIEINNKYEHYILCAQRTMHKKVWSEVELIKAWGDIGKLSSDNHNLNQIVSGRLYHMVCKLNNTPPLKYARRLTEKFKVTQDEQNDSLKKIYKTALESGKYIIDIINKTEKKCQIIGLIRERNEELILEDTLNEMEKVVDGFVVLDDCSTDNSLEIIKKHKKCLAIIRHTEWNNNNRSTDESIHRQLLLETAKDFNPSWLLYQDADERIVGNVRYFLLKHLNDDNVSAVRMSLYDAYMTQNNYNNYTGGELLNFRTKFGPERRDIIMAWKNIPQVTFLNNVDAREPFNIDDNKIITKFNVQHYGKALSVDQWEDTCDYYVQYFPQYAEKWKKRKGRGIHNEVSDFGGTLMSWEEVTRTGGIKIN